MVSNSVFMNLFRGGWKLFGKHPLVSAVVLLLLWHFSFAVIGLDLPTAQAQVMSWVEKGAAQMLVGLMQFLGYISVAGAALFAWLLNADVVEMILNAPIIPLVWEMVRDFLNLMFILVLLFSAFATIFQVERFHLRNILIKLVIMALLVNFSLPVARVVIDTGNIIMYFFVERLFPDVNEGSGQAMASMFGEYTNIANVLLPNPDGVTEVSTYLLVAIIFTFVYGVLLMTVAVILAIRLVALAFLMIMSPVGFVAGILPSTAQYASRWWGNLFKYTFNGPILVFILFFAVQFMGLIHTGAFDRTDPNSPTRLEQAIASGATVDSQTTLIADIAFLIMPVIVMVMGIFATLSGSDAASAYVTDLGRGALRGAANRLRRGGYYAAGVTAQSIPGSAYAAGLAKSFKINTQRRRQRFESAVERHTERMAASRVFPISGRRAAARIDAFGKSVAEAQKQMEHFSSLDLNRKIDSMLSSKAEKAAAAQMLAERGDLDLEHLTTAMESIGEGIETARVRANIENSMNRNHRGTLAAYAATQNRRVAFNNNNQVQVVENPAQAIHQYFNVSASQLGEQRDLDVLTNAGLQEIAGQYIDQNVITNLETARNAARNANVNTREHLAHISENFRNHVADI